MSQLTAEEAEAIGRVLRALEAHEAAFVVVGGWAHRLMRRHPAAHPPAHAPLLTADLDVACPERLHGRSEDELGTAIARAGFAPDFHSDDQPPVTHYLLKAPRFQLEFIAPLVGSGARRDGSAKVTANLLGLSAQLIRGVELLRVEPWRAALPEVAPGLSVNVANPVSYVLQKLLSASQRRTRGQEGKDLLYIYDTIALFSVGPRLEGQVARQAARVRRALTKKMLGKLAENRQKYFQGVTDPLREAERIARGAGRRAVSADQLRLACSSGLAELLGEV